MNCLYNNINQLNAIKPFNLEVLDIRYNNISQINFHLPISLYEFYIEGNPSIKLLSSTFIWKLPDHSELFHCKGDYMLRDKLDYKTMYFSQLSYIVI